MFLQSAIYIVFVLLLIVSALLLLVVLMQRPKQEGLGAAFGAQTTDVLKKGTVLFGTLFMLLCFVLAVLMNAQYKRSHPTDLTDDKHPMTQQPADSPQQSDAPTAPAVETAGATNPAEEAPAEAH